MKSVSTLVAPESVAQPSLLILWHKIKVGADLTDLYGIPAKALDQAVRRNLKRFPSNLMYQLTVEEKQEELDRKISSNNQTIASLINAIRQLMQVPAGFSHPIGFTTAISKLRSK